MLNALYWQKANVLVKEVCYYSNPVRMAGCLSFHQYTMPAIGGAYIFANFGLSHLGLAFLPCYLNDAKEIKGSTAELLLSLLNQSLEAIHFNDGWKARRGWQKQPEATSLNLQPNWNGRKTRQQGEWVKKKKRNWMRIGWTRKQLQPGSGADTSAGHDMFFSFFETCYVCQSVLACM